MQSEIAVLYVCMIILCAVIMMLVVEQRKIIKRQSMEAEIIQKLLDILNNARIYMRRGNENPKDKP